MRVKEICFPTCGILFILVQVGLKKKGIMKFDPTLHHISTATMSNLPLNFTYVSLFYSHCQSLSSRLRLRLWACFTSQVLATLYIVRLVRECHFPHDTFWLKTQAYQIHVCLFTTWHQPSDL